MSNLQGPVEGLPFDDSEENLKLENELLEMKMQIESGALLHKHADMNPALEHEYLKQVQRYENARQTAKLVKLYDFIGRPPYRNADGLTDDEFEVELQKLKKILATYGLELESQWAYIPEDLYRFITSQLFDEMIEDVLVPGMTKTFMYEEFLSWQERDIRRITSAFMHYWGEHQLSAIKVVFASEMFLPDATPISKGEFLSRLQHYFDAYPRFYNLRCNIELLEMECNNTMAQVYGQVAYEVETEIGERIAIEDSYTINFACKADNWEIFCLIMPDFTSR